MPDKTMTTRSAHTKRVIVAEHASLGAGLVEAGGLLFTSGWEGQRRLDTGEIDSTLADAVEQQCENAYGGIAALLARTGVGMESVVRLDHYTRSQDWLPRRQTVRGRIFGKPAPLTSTGVAATMAGINLLSAAAVAVRSPAQKNILVSGPAFGMENISSSVAAGPFIFVSGLRTAAAGPALVDQSRASYEKLRSILEKSGVHTDQLVRLESFLRLGCDGNEDTAACREVLGDTTWAASSISLVLGGRGDLEITAMALAPGHGSKALVRLPGSQEIAAVQAGGFVFVGACFGADLGQALDQLARRLALAGTSLAGVARLDITLREGGPNPQHAQVLSSYFSEGLPAVVSGGADPGHDAAVGVSAIAV